MKNTKSKIKLKVQANNHDDVAWVLDELEKNFYCFTSGVRPSSEGGAHGLVTIFRDLGMKDE